MHTLNSDCTTGATLDSPCEELNAITDAEYGQIRDYFYKYSGIFFDDCACVYICVHVFPSGPLGFCTYLFLCTCVNVCV